MELASVTWLMIHLLRIGDVEMHFWDSFRTEQITTEVPIRHGQLLIKSISESAVKRNSHAGYVRLGLVRLHYIIHQSFIKQGIQRVRGKEITTRDRIGSVIFIV